MPPESTDPIADALASGESDRANRVIAMVDSFRVEERAAVFDDYFEVASDVYAAADGYVRQSAVRFAESLHPGLALRAVGRLNLAEPVPGEHTLEDAARHRRRLWEYFLDALVDEDGRVRRAASNGVKTIAVAADVIGQQDELESLLTDLESLATEADEAAEPHVVDAIGQVAFYLDGSPFSVLEGLEDG